MTAPAKELRDEYDSMTPDVLMIGAGVAGLSAARVLSAAGIRVLLLEGRDRIGGRVFTRATAQYPVELGAEYIHGSPPEIMELVKQAGLPLAEVEWNILRREGDRWHDAGEMMFGIERVFEKMSADQPDQSFRQFLAGVDEPPAAKEQALAFVEGFHAADPGLISVHSLIKANAAEREIHDDQQFRFIQGYETLVRSISERIDWEHCELQLNTIIAEIEWKPGEALARTASGVEFRAPQAIISVPLGVLKAGGIRFLPRLEDKEKALQGLEMGPVVRVSLCFHNKFWESQARFKDVGFLFTDDANFRTWWTSPLLPFPVFTGWAAGGYARALNGLSAEQVIARASESLAGILDTDVSVLRRELQAGFTHDWQADPFSHGAYSYSVVGGSNAGHGLGVPVANTLFFAGEATNAEGHNGTVHGAIASANRVAQEVLAVHRR